MQTTLRNRLGALSASSSRSDSTLSRASRHRCTASAARNRRAKHCADNDTIVLQRI